MKDALDEVAAREVPDAHDRWPAIRAAVARRRARARWRSAGAGLALAAALLVGLVVAGHGDQPLGGDALLGRAEAATSGAAARSYHLRATRTYAPALGPTQTLTEEAWLGAGGQAVRREVHGQMFPNNRVGDTTVIADGSHTWWRAVIDGRTYVAQAVNIRAEDGGPLAPEGGSIADAIAQLVKVTQDGCATARLTGEATVAGRSAYVVAVTPTGSCIKGAPLTVWLDRQTYLPLRSEEVGPKGRSLYEVTSLEVDPPIAAGTFRYSPPPDATVFADARDMKMALAGVSPSKDATPPRR